MTTTLTLRARPDLGSIERGMLMASQTGKTVYRVHEVVRVSRQDGPRAECFYRLVLVRLEPPDVPPGAAIHPWKLAAPERRPTAAPTPAPARRPVPGEITQRRRQDQAAQLARAQRVGREEQSGYDLGPEVRRRFIRDRSGRLLREPDCAVKEDVPDPHEPNRTLRKRAYRSDPLLALKRSGSIGEREVDAAEELRLLLEDVTPRLGGFNDDGVQGSPFNRLPVVGMLSASLKLRRIAADLRDLWMPVLWICAGGTVSALAEHWQLRLQTVTDLVRDGLKALADHLYGTATRDAA